jgi:hypothetical protein
VYSEEEGLAMKSGTSFPIDPGDMHALAFSTFAKYLQRFGAYLLSPDAQTV